MKKIYKYPTGAEIPEGAVYLSTVVEGNCHHEEAHPRYVWHYFLVEVKE